MHCNFSKKQQEYNLEVNMGEDIESNDGEINDDDTHMIQAGWLKWGKAEGLFVIAKHLTSSKAGFVVLVYIQLSLW